MIFYLYDRRRVMKKNDFRRAGHNHRLDSVFGIILVGYFPHLPSAISLGAQLLLWIVVSILKHGHPSGRTLDDTIYDDQKIGPCQ